MAVPYLRNVVRAPCLGYGGRGGGGCGSSRGRGGGGGACQVVGVKRGQVGGVRGVAPVLR